MAPRKKATPTGDDKSPQLAAAAVGAGTELLQAQPQPKKDGEVLVDPDAEAARLEAEQQAAEEARLAAEAQGVDLVAEAAKQAEMLGVEQTLEEEVDISDAALVMAVEEHQPDWLLGQFDVKAKLPAGFWRCEVQFLHSSATRVFVVTAKADVPHEHSCEIPCCYLTAEQAQRVYHDQWLVCTEYEVMGG